MDSLSPILSALIGLVIGFAGVGLPTLRTIQTIEGRYISVFFVCVLCTICLFIFTNMVVAKNIYFMVANIIGGSLSVSMMAWQRRKK